MYEREREEVREGEVRQIVAWNLVVLSLIRLKIIIHDYSEHCTLQVQVQALVSDESADWVTFTYLSK